MAQILFLSLIVRYVTAAAHPKPWLVHLTQANNQAKCVENGFKGEFLTSKISGFFNNKIESIHKFYLKNNTD